MVAIDKLRYKFHSVESYNGLTRNIFNLIRQILFKTVYKFWLENVLTDRERKKERTGTIIFLE
jgi:hypothetical protein